ncbi:MAG TPA: glycosyltransferase family A protein [Polyangiaceae bacterium]|nr:glycosyltransferase family A protein [Polyangiaceae bacterium]
MNSQHTAPRVTIAIATLNRADLLQQAIDSAIAQTYPSLEIIVSNNGSTDNTQKLLERYEGSDRVRIIHLKNTISANEHGAFLVDQAQGELFLALSDDDWIEPEMIANVVELFDNHPQITFVWTGCWMHYGPVKVPALTGPLIESGPSLLAAFLAGKRDIRWCACVSRTADLQRLGPLPENTICGDMYFWTKLASEGDVGCIEKILSHYSCYRKGGDGMAGGTPIMTWTNDQKQWVNDILKTCHSQSAGKVRFPTLSQDARHFLARTVGNQFVHNALRGESRLALLRAVPPSFNLLKQGPMLNWVSVMASLLSPRWLLENRMLAEAKRKSKARIENPEKLG